LVRPVFYFPISIQFAHRKFTVADGARLVEYLYTMLSGFQCASCGEWNETTIDESAGSRQGYVEDCQVCCKPNLLLVTWNRTDGEFMISAELE
jgi:hypothetical protein